MLYSNLLLLGLAMAEPTGGGETLQGVWQARSYLLAGGVQHPVGGRIFFSGSQWTVLFFVLDGQGEPVRASAEGGRFEVDEDRLTFTHQFHFSGGEGLDGLPASPFRMDLDEEAEAAREPCTFRLQGDELSIFFPSGNSMHFRRGSP